MQHPSPSANSTTMAYGNDQQPDASIAQLLEDINRAGASQQDARLTEEAILSVLANFMMKKDALLQDAGNIEAALVPVRAELASQLDAIKETRALTRYPTPYAGAALAAEQADTPSENRLTELTFHAVDFMVIVAHAVRTKPDAWDLQLLSLMSCILPFIRAQQQQAPLPADSQIDASQVNYAVMAANIQLELTQDSDSGAYYSLSATGHAGGANTQQFLSHSFPSDILDELEALYAKALGYWQTSNDEDNRRFAERLYQPQRKGQLNEHSLLPWVSELTATRTGLELPQLETLQCLKHLSTKILKQFQCLFWAIATGAIAADTEIGLERKTIFAAGQRLTELVDTNKFKIFVQQATETTLNTKTGRRQTTAPDKAALWQEIQHQAQTHAEAHVLSQLVGYERYNTLIEALDKKRFELADALLKPSLIALMQRFLNNDRTSVPSVLTSTLETVLPTEIQTSPQLREMFETTSAHDDHLALSELFVIDAFRRLADSHHPHLTVLADIVFNMVMALNICQIDNTATLDKVDATAPGEENAGKAEEVDLDEPDVLTRLDGGHTEQSPTDSAVHAISVHEALIKVRCLLTFIIASKLRDQASSQRYLSQALYYSSFVGTGNPIVGRPNYRENFPALAQKNIEILFICLDESVAATQAIHSGKKIALTLKCLYANPALDMLIEYFRGSTIDPAGIQLESFFDDWLQSALNQPVASITAAAERVEAVETALLALCARKITFEVQQVPAMDVVHLTVNQLNEHQRTQQIQKICASRRTAFTAINRLKLRMLQPADTRFKNYSFEPLMTACRYGNTPALVTALQDLIKAKQGGVLGNKLGDALAESLQLACNRGHTKVVMTLIQVAVYTHTTQFIAALQDRTGCTLLHLACLGKQSEIVVALVKALVYTQQTQALSVRDHRGDTPLHLACRHDDTQTAIALIKALLETGQTQELLATAVDEQTPLHTACYHDRNETAIAMMKLLIHARQIQALVARDSSCKTFLDIAQQKGQAHIIQATYAALTETTENASESTSALSQANPVSRASDVYHQASTLLDKRLLSELGLKGYQRALSTSLTTAIAAYVEQGENEYHSLQHVKHLQSLLGELNASPCSRDTIAQLITALKHTLSDGQIPRQHKSLKILLMHSISHRLNLAFSIHTHMERSASRLHQTHAYKTSATTAFLRTLEAQLALLDEVLQAEHDADTAVQTLQHH